MERIMITEGATEGNEAPTDTDNWRFEAVGYDAPGGLQKVRGVLEDVLGSERILKRTHGSLLK